MLISSASPSNFPIFPFRLICPLVNSYYSYLLQQIVSQAETGTFAAVKLVDDEDVTGSWTVGRVHFACIYISNNSKSSQLLFRNFTELLAILHFQEWLEMIAPCIHLRDQFPNFDQMLQEAPILVPPIITEWISLCRHSKFNVKSSRT